MALLFYTDQTLSTELVTLTTEHASTGEAVEARVFIANLDPAFRYEQILISAEDTELSTNEAGWITLAPDNAGTAGTYQAEPLAIADISDNAPYSFWVRVTTPDVGTAQNKTDLRLNATFKEYAV